MTSYDLYLESGPLRKKTMVHVLAVPGAYLSAMVGGVTGFSRLGSAAARGDVPLPEALRRIEEMAARYVRATTTEQRAAVLHSPTQIRTLRKALRRMLEHD